MDVLIFILVCVVALLASRHRLARSSIDWRSLAGFLCGALVGLLFGRLLTNDSTGLVRNAGVPWLVLRMLLVIVGGVAAAGPVREILERAFPTGREKRRSEDAAGQR